jgi:hypothetical protein
MTGGGDDGDDDYDVGGTGREEKRREERKLSSYTVNSQRVFGSRQQLPVFVAWQTGSLEVRSILQSDADFYTACISAVVDARKQQDIRPSAHQCCVLVCIQACSHCIPCQRRRILKNASLEGVM